MNLPPLSMRYLSASIVFILIYIYILLNLYISEFIIVVLFLLINIHSFLEELKWRMRKRMRKYVRKMSWSKYTINVPTRFILLIHSFVVGVLSSIFGLFKPFLPKIDSMQTMQVDIKYH